MNLDRKLKDTTPEERQKFLLWKYKELRLIHSIDRITDRYTSLKPLLEKSLQAVLKIFKCRIAGFLLSDGGKRADGGFFFKSTGSSKPDQIECVKEVLTRFLVEPQVHLFQENPKDDEKSVGLKNYLIMPMVITSEISGAFLLGTRKKMFHERDLHFLKVLSSQLDNAVVFARSQEDYKKTSASLKLRARELDILYEMSLSLGYGYDFETLATKVLENAMQLANVDRSSVMLYDAKTDELKTQVVVGEKQKIRLVKLGIGKGIAGMALMARQPLLAQKGSEDSRFVPFDFTGIKPKKINSLLCLPLYGSDKPLGVINFVMLSRKKTFADKDMETLSVAANMITLALQRQEFYQLSIKDELTGLYTFRYFKERFGEEVARAKRYKMVGSLVVFDLDHFKSINDTYGHPFGNVVLKAVAEILRNSVRQGIDLPVRFGGEEMALILPHTSHEGAMILAERIRHKIEMLQLTFEGKPVKITISGGVSAFPTHGDEPEIVLKKADDALYRAKENGRNRIELGA